MADSLFDILGQRDFDEPSESKAIKAYIKEKYKVAVEVITRDRDIIITSPSASLAGTLRFHIPQLKAITKTDKRIVLRIR